MDKELKLIYKLEKYDEKKTKKNMKESGHLFKNKITDGKGKNIPGRETYPEE